MAEQCTRKKNVDFLRFIFAVFIVMYHFSVYGEYNLSAGLFDGISHANICVEFFFILAGYFLFNHINTEQDTFDFMKKRFFRLAPLVWVQLILCMILGPFFHFGFSFDGNILRIFLLDGSGLSPSTGLTGITLWFVSVLFWVGVFYFYLYKIFDKKYLNLIIWILTVGSLSMVINDCDYGYIFGITNNIAGVFNAGVLRGIYGFGIGYFISILGKREFLQSFNDKLSGFIFSVLEIFLFFIVVYYMLISDKILGGTPFLHIFLFSFLFYLFIIRKGILTKALDNNVSVFLGRYSYSIYVMHILAGAVFNSIAKSHFDYIIVYPHRVFLVKVICAVLFGILVYHVFEKPIQKLVKKFL